jgi:hypothetical protein
MEDLLTFITSTSSIHYQLGAIYTVIAIGILGFTLSERAKKMNTVSKLFLSFAFLLASAVILDSTIANVRPYNAAVKELQKAVNATETTCKKACSEKKLSDPSSVGSTDNNHLFCVACELRIRQIKWMWIYIIIYSTLVIAVIWREEISSIIKAFRRNFW